VERYNRKPYEDTDRMYQVHKREKGHAGRWKPMQPWPSVCQMCFTSIDRTTYSRKIVESIGHWPPIKWIEEHPNYSGPMILRPEHTGCNARNVTFYP
jgi:hypothetical protein